MLVHSARVHPHSALLHDLALKLGNEGILGLHLVVMRGFLYFELLLDVDDSLLELLRLLPQLFDDPLAGLIFVTHRSHFQLKLLFLVFEPKVFLLDLGIGDLLDVLVFFDVLLLLIDLLEVALDLFVQVLILVREPLDLHLRF